MKSWRYISDFEHYPDWVDSMKSAEVLTSVAGKAKTVRMVLDHTLVKDIRAGVRVEAAGRQPEAYREPQGDGRLLRAENQGSGHDSHVHIGRRHQHADDRDVQAQG